MDRQSSVTLGLSGSGLSVLAPRADPDFRFYAAALDSRVSARCNAPRARHGASRLADRCRRFAATYVASRSRASSTSALSAARAAHGATQRLSDRYMRAMASAEAYTAIATPYPHFN